MLSRHPLHVAVALALLAGASTSAHASADTSADANFDARQATELDEIVVHPQLESQMRAIDYKRGSDAIQDTVSSDSMGQYPDKNVGESLQRLPGISVTRDQGEGRFVVVRGLDAALNSVQVDGITIGTPEDSSRAAPLDVIPSDSTERLTVIKSPTPDMPGDSVGGAILVESASGLDRKGRHIRGKAEMSHQSLSGETSPKASFNYSNNVDDRFGIALGLSYQDRTYESDNIEAEYDYHDSLEDLPDHANDLVAIEVQQRKYFVNRERTGVNLNLDWRTDDDSHYYLRTLYTDFTDAETRQNSIIPVGEGDITGINGRSYTVEGIDPGDFSRRVRWRTKAEDTFTVSAGGENRFENSAIDYRVGYTKTRERVTDEVEARFSNDGDDDISVILDQGGGIPRYTINDPANGWLSNENYSFNRFVVAPTMVDDDEVSAAFNLRVDGDAVSWKTGLVGRWRDRDVNIDEAELRRGPSFLLSDWSIGSPDYRHGNMGDGINSQAMRDYLAARLGEYSARPQDVVSNTEVSLVEDYVAGEDILAGYFMGTMDFDNLRVIFGARVERTSFDATGNVVDIDEDGELASITQRHVSSDYTRVLPGLHLRYDGQNDWVFRGAYTHTIGRPSFGDISPRTRINREDEEVDLGNPDLAPYKSRNLDLSAERYIGDSGIFSAGLFHKQIAGYIVETNTRNHPDWMGYDVTTPVNGDDASVLGAELNFQQRFDTGLLLGVSATWLDTEFKLAGETFPLPLSSEKLLSAHVGYENDRLSTRLAAVYRSEYLNEVGENRDFDIWVAPNTQLDFSLDYRVNDIWSLYFEASNLLDEPLELYQGSSANTLQNELYGRTYVAGVKLRF